MTETGVQESAGLKRVGQGLLKVLSLFVILEPIWMLLPFAGFLYGSVLHIQTLNRNPTTAWLTHFVFPVLTLGWVGPALVLVGVALFLVGAGQIYWAKFRRSGLVTKGDAVRRGNSAHMGASDHVHRVLRHDVPVLPSGQE